MGMLRSLFTTHRFSSSIASAVSTFDAAHVLAVLRVCRNALAGTVDAATSHIATLILSIRLLNRQIKGAIGRVRNIKAMPQSSPRCLALAESCLLRYLLRPGMACAHCAA
jgi:hypothetical protein